jgi:hypothetical protein
MPYGRLQVRFRHWSALLWGVWATAGGGVGGPVVSGGAYADSAGARQPTRNTACWLTLVLALLVTGCTGHGTRTVLCVNPTPPTPLALEEGSDDQTLLATVAWVVHEHLGLPLSSPLYAYLYPTQDAFEHGLQRDGGITPARARTHATFSWGVATRHSIHLRADRLGTTLLVRRVGLIAHELTHISQYALAGGDRGGSEQWLREGVADWVRFRVLEHFGLVPYATSISQLHAALRRQPADQGWPRLLALASHRQWVTARAAHGAIGTYGQAALAVHRLAEQAGAAAIVDYFRRAAHTRDAGALFQAAFGITREAFSAAWEAERERLVGTSAVSSLQ